MPNSRSDSQNVFSTSDSESGYTPPPHASPVRFYPFPFWGGRRWYDSPSDASETSDESYSGPLPAQMTDHAADKASSHRNARQGRGAKQTTGSLKRPTPPPQTQKKIRHRLNDFKRLIWREYKTLLNMEKQWDEAGKPSIVLPAEWTGVSKTLCKATRSVKKLEATFMKNLPRQTPL